VAFPAPKSYACCDDPVPCFEFTPYDAECVGTTITFNASDSYDPDDTDLTYAWDFGDEETGTGEIVTHSYDEGGEYTVTLTVTDNDNPDCCDSADPNCVDGEDEDSQTVTVVGVDFVTEDKTSACVGEDINFYGSCLSFGGAT